MLKYFPDEIASINSIFIMGYICTLGFIVATTFFMNRSDRAYEFNLKLFWPLIAVASIFCFLIPRYWLLSPMIVLIGSLYSLKIIYRRAGLKKILLTPYAIMAILALCFTVSELRSDIVNFHKHQIASIIASNTTVNVASQEDIYVQVPLLAGIPVIGPQEYSGYAHISKLKSGNSICYNENYFVSYIARITGYGPTLSTDGNDVRRIHCNY